MSFTIGYKGAPGAHVESAAKIAYHKEQVTYKNFKDNKELFEALISEQVQKIIVPIENSISGNFLQNLDQIAKNHPKVTIVEELIVEEKNALLANSGTKLDQVTKVYSHPSIFDQYGTELRSLAGKDLEHQIGNSTSDCAQLLRDTPDSSSAVIANPVTAQLYNLEILQHLKAPVPNVTRYFILATKGVATEKHQMPKTSLMLIMKNAPGVLFKVLSAFALRDINVSKIESRASARTIRTGSPWEYIMFVDVEGSPESNPKLQNAINNLGEFATEVKNLGSYPRHFPDLNMDKSPVGL